MLIVGLGNPGPNYEKTRHNIGFMVIDELIKRFSATKQSSLNFQGNLFKFQNTSISLENHFLLQPLTFMNLSGESVVKVKNFYKIDKVVVIHDDLDLPFGALRFKFAGGDGGHNGLRSLDTHISKNYARIRIGIGKPEYRSEVASYVLSNFTVQESECLEKLIVSACDAIEFMLKNSFEDTSSKFSQKGSLC